MYGFKEKMKYFNELRNSVAAGADLCLLQAAAPAHPKLRMFTRNPQRYADDILYTLLDLKSKEAIRINRRECENAKENAGEDKPEGIGELSKEAVSANQELSESVIVKGDVDSTQEEKQEAEERVTQAEEQAEVLEQKNQELKEELETEQDARAEAEERAEQAEQALEEEKKKEPTKVASKSKSTKSTRKSTGKTSKTKTSK